MFGFVVCFVNRIIAVDWNFFVVPFWELFLKDGALMEVWVGRCSGFGFQQVFY